MQQDIRTVLSTPHGALGTYVIVERIDIAYYFQLHTVH